MAKIDMLRDIFDQITAIKNTTDKFISAQDQLASSEVDRLKRLYDAGREVFQTEESVLPELITAGFDDEQIWQELELGCNSSAIQRQKDIERLFSVSSKPFFLNDKKVDNYIDSKNGSSLAKKPLSSDDDEEDSALSEDDSESEGEGIEDNIENSITNVVEKNQNGNAKNVNTNNLEKKLKDAESVNTNNVEKMQKSTAESVNTNDVEKKQKTTAVKKKSGGKSSIVDDEFFKLSDMNDFLDAQDRKESRKTLHEDDDSSDDDDNDEDDDNADLNISASDSDNEPMGKDFFGDETKEDDNADDSDKDEIEDSDDDASDDEKASEEEEESSDEEEKKFWNNMAENNVKKAEIKSSFEKTQERLKREMASLEEANLASNMLEKKPWQLRGEVTASARPMDSLIDEDLNFEISARPPPDNSEDTFKTIEQFMILRIKDKAWDDVERKVKPTNTGYDYKKRIVLDQEQSKLGLAEEYAQAYLKEGQKQVGKEFVEKENPQVIEVRKSMEKLFRSLDALSNFHYTPKPVVRDIKIISNEPSITIENVGPSFMSDAAMLAPEQIQNKTKGQLVGATEKTRADKKRERRKKKKLQHNKRLTEEKKDKLKSASGQETKESAMKKLEKKSKSSKGITILKQTKGRGSKKASSSSVFNQLQEDITANLKRKKAALVSDNMRKTKKIKL